MASNDKGNKNDAPKKEPAPETKRDAPKKEPTPETKSDAPKKDGSTETKSDVPKKDASTETKDSSNAEPSKPGDAPASAPSNYSRGEGQKPVSKAYRDNWSAIWGKKKKR